MRRTAVQALRNLGLVVVICALAFVPALVDAQDYPTRPVTLMCWSEPGSPVDLFARAMAKLLTRESARM